MNSKTLVLSSSGLKNIVTGKLKDDQFQFIFGQHKISMNNIFAEFISLKVSNIHKIDSTINSISFDYIFDKEISESAISKFQLIASGETIEINEEEIFEMKLISILVDNEELFCKLNDLSNNNINESNINEHMPNFAILFKISPSCSFFNYSNTIDLISMYFYAIDKEKLKQLPTSALYSIICNQNLQIKSEDSLFDFINEIFTNKDENDDLISFYEQIEFDHLSENKFEEFLNIFHPTKMTNELWKKLNCCFYTRKKQISSETIPNRYFQGEEYKYDGNSSHNLCGIIDQLTKESGGNVCDNGTVKVTSSSVYDVTSSSACEATSKYGPKYAVKFNSFNKSDNFYFFHSRHDDKNSWLKYDFVKRKVSPTGYSIRTRGGYNDSHPRNWVIEGSNNDSDWTILDTRQNETCLTGLGVTCYFNIQYIVGSYRFLRIRQTGVNSSGTHGLLLSALEFFGTLIQQ